MLIILAVQAAILHQDKSEEIGEMFVFKVSSQTMSMKTQKIASGDRTALIKRNTAIPTECNVTLSTSSENQSELPILIYQGETNDFHNFDHYHLTCIPPATRGEPKIKVAFYLDDDERLWFLVVDEGTWYKDKIRITEDAIG